MSWLNYFRGKQAAPPQTASVAKERLQIVLAHERIGRSGEDFLPKLQKEIVDLVMKYVTVDPEKVNVSLERGGDLSTLAVAVEIPGPPAARRAS